jgi:hypothetical protein
MWWNLAHWKWSRTWLPGAVIVKLGVAASALGTEDTKTIASSETMRRIVLRFGMAMTFLQLRLDWARSNRGSD